MNAFFALMRRNLKLFFKDKGVFFHSLITPLILLGLFIAFLGNIYRNGIRSIAAVGGVTISDGLVESIVSGWFISSLVAVCTVTIAFTANIVMVQDKAQGQVDDFFVSPVSKSMVALAYFFSTYLITLLICAFALLAGFIYISIAGWYLSAQDVCFAVLDLLLLSLFGTAFSCVVCKFLRSSGSIAAVQTTVSSAYGLICGAYMPLGNLAVALRNVIMFLPGTYGTGLLHLHLMGRAIAELPPTVADAMKRGFDCTLVFFEHTVPVWVCYFLVVFAIIVLVAVYLILSFTSHRRKISS